MRHLLLLPFLLWINAAAAQEPIVLGQSAALTGNAAELGTEMRLGANLYFDAINKAGGINGRQIKLVTLDDGYDPVKAAENTKKLINEQQVFALFGYVGTPTSAAALPIFTEAKVPFVAPFTGAALLREPLNRYIFNVRASYDQETEKMVELLTSLGTRNIAVFYQNDSYGQAGLAGVEKAMVVRGLKPIATATVERNSVDVSKAVAALGGDNVQAVIMVSAYKSCAAFIKEMKKAGKTKQYVNVSFVGSKALSKELGEQGRGVMISQVMPFPWSVSAPVVVEYQQRLKASDPALEYSFTSLEGYIGAKVMVEGLRRAGKNLSREGFITAMESMNNVDVGGFVVNYSSKDHLGSRYVDMSIISRDGKFQR
jgi:branched-chain amino acid transport system substrate-binding protein